MARAAERLAISRPVVSKAIAYLERSLKVVLLDRTARGVEPTVFGNALSKRGAALFDELRSTAEELSYLADPATGELRIASTEVWAAGLIPAAIEQLRSKFPRLRLRLEQGTAQSQFDLLRGRSSELVVSRLLTASPDPDIDCEPLFYEKLVVVAGPQSSWARQKRLRLKNLVEAQWILSPLELEKKFPVHTRLSGGGPSGSHSAGLEQLTSPQKWSALGRRIHHSSARKCLALWPGKNALASTETGISAVGCSDRDFLVEGQDAEPHCTSIYCRSAPDDKRPFAAGMIPCLEETVRCHRSSWLQVLRKQTVKQIISSLAKTCALRPTKPESVFARR